MWYLFLETGIRPLSAHLVVNFSVSVPSPWDSSRYEGNVFSVALRRRF